MREPLPVMQDPGAIFFLLFPVVGELHRTPMRDMSVFAFPKHPIEHSRGTQEADMSAMQWRERPTMNVSLFGKQNAAGLTVGCGVRQQILDFVERNSRIGQCDWPRLRNLIPRWGRMSQCFKIGFSDQHLQPAHGVEQRGVSQMLVSPTPDAEDGNLLVLHTRRVR